MDTSVPTPSAEKRTVEAWAAQKSLPAWLFAALRAHERWAIGAERTEAEFDEAIARVQALRFF